MTEPVVILRKQLRKKSAPTPRQKNVSTEWWRNDDFIPLDSPEPIWDTFEMPFGLNKGPERNVSQIGPYGAGE